LSYQLTTNCPMKSALAAGPRQAQATPARHSRPACPPGRAIRHCFQQLAHSSALFCTASNLPPLCLQHVTHSFALLGGGGLNADGAALARQPSPDWLRLRGETRLQKPAHRTVCKNRSEGSYGLPKTYRGIAKAVHARSKR